MKAKLINAVGLNPLWGMVAAETYEVEVSGDFCFYQGRLLSRHRFSFRLDETQPRRKLVISIDLDHFPELEKTWDEIRRRVLCIRSQEDDVGPVQTHIGEEVGEWKVVDDSSYVVIGTNEYGRFIATRGSKRTCNRYIKNNPGDLVLEKER